MPSFIFLIEFDSFFRMAEALISAADQNSDGKLQFGEFKNAIEIVSKGESS